MIGSLPKVDFQPPRSLYSFLIQPSRWSVIHYAKLNRRIKTNLLYFQTNYMMLGLVCFAGFVLLSMRTLLTGLISALVVLGAALFFTDNIPRARQIKQNHPTLVVLAGFIMLLVAWHSLHTMVIVVAAGLSPVPLWLIHAALRSSDALIDGSQIAPNHFASTPFGLVMQAFGIEATAYMSE